MVPTCLRFWRTGRRLYIESLPVWHVLESSKDVACVTTTAILPSSPSSATRTMS
jgi:hypothetical protein